MSTKSIWPTMKTTRDAMLTTRCFETSTIDEITFCCIRILYFLYPRSINIITCFNIFYHIERCREKHSDSYDKSFFLFEVVEFEKSVLGNIVGGKICGVSFFWSRGSYFSEGVCSLLPMFSHHVPTWILFSFVVINLKLLSFPSPWLLLFLVIWHQVNVFHNKSIIYFTQDCQNHKRTT